MEVLHEDAEILIVDKPAGLSVIRDGWNPGTPCLVEQLEVHRPKVWVVHRLDKVTSGVLVLALTAEAHRSLSMQFERHEVEKKYHVLLNGNPGWDEKTTRFPLRVNVGRRHRTVVDDHKGLRAETFFRIRARHPAHVLAEAIPRTGRTHQIRVHAYALGHALLGDTLYGAPPTDRIARPALHAFELTVTHPDTGERLTFRAPYPDDFRTALEKLEAG